MKRTMPSLLFKKSSTIYQSLACVKSQDYRISEYELGVPDDWARLPNKKRGSMSITTYQKFL